METEKLLTLIQNFYPNHFKDFDPEMIEIQAKLWQRSLSEYTWAEVMTTFEVWVNTEIYPPRLAEFKPLVAKYKNPSAFVSPERAWEVVDSAVRRFGSYNQEKAFKTFSEPIRRAVRAIGGWQKVCSTELGRDWDFLKKNFIEAFTDFGQDAKEQELLPQSVLNRLQELSQSKLESPKIEERQ